MYRDHNMEMVLILEQVSEAIGFKLDLVSILKILEYSNEEIFNEIK
jgi:hypothetical protein